MIRTSLLPSLTLAKMLDAFDPQLHGGEVMATRPIGNEAFSTPHESMPEDRRANRTQSRRSEAETVRS